MEVDGMRERERDRERERKREREKQSLRKRGRTLLKTKEEAHTHKSSGKENKEQSASMFTWIKTFNKVSMRVYMCRIIKEKSYHLKSMKNYIM